MFEKRRQKIGRVFGEQSVYHVLADQSDLLLFDISCVSLQASRNARGCSDKTAATALPKLISSAAAVVYN